MNKKNVFDVLQFVKKNNIHYDKSTSKTKLLESIESHFIDYLQLITYKKATDMNLVELGINLKKRIDKLIETHTINVIIIENQIGPLAARMKSIQSMLSQYFIMNDMLNIEFINASNKLKLFSSQKLNYSERKKKGTEITKLLINKQNHTSWKTKFNKSKKKDDLADCFLQAIWYLANKGIINTDQYIL